MHKKDVTLKKIEITNTSPLTFRILYHTDNENKVILLPATLQEPEDMLDHISDHLKKIEKHPSDNDNPLAHFNIVHVNNPEEHITKLKGYFENCLEKQRNNESLEGFKTSLE